MLFLRRSRYAKVALITFFLVFLTIKITQFLHKKDSRRFRYVVSFWVALDNLSRRPGSHKNATTPPESNVETPEISLDFPKIIRLRPFLSDRGTSDTEKRDFVRNVR